MGLLLESIGAAPTHLLRSSPSSHSCSPLCPKEIAGLLRSAFVESVLSPGKDHVTLLKLALIDISDIAPGARPMKRGMGLRLAMQSTQAIG